jgi:hypothetical protein
VFFARKTPIDLLSVTLVECQASDNDDGEPREDERTDRCRIQRKQDGKPNESCIEQLVPLVRGAGMDEC